jgi:uracil-DNA glycosylase family 4
MDGNPESDLMFIGEATGYHEDKQGLPFVGAAGQLLDKTLASIGFTRSDCSVVNVLKCRPPSNRDPLPDEIESCRPYLEAQIHFIRPKVIVTLGNFATRFVLARQVSISRVRGQRFTAYGATVIPTFHPAAVLRGGGLASKAMESLRTDFALVKEVLEESREAAAYEPTEQQALF